MPLFRLIDFIDARPALRARCIALSRVLGVHGVAERLYMRPRPDARAIEDADEAARQASSSAPAADRWIGNRVVRDGVDVDVFIANLERKNTMPVAGEDIRKPDDPGCAGGPRARFRDRLFQALFTVSEPVLSRLRTYFLDGAQSRFDNRHLLEALRQEVACLRAGQAELAGSIGEARAASVDLAARLAGVESRVDHARDVSSASWKELSREISETGVLQARRVDALIEGLAPVAALSGRVDRVLGEQRDVAAELLAARQSLVDMKPQLDRMEAYGLAAARRVAVNCGAGEVLVRTEVGYVLCAATDPALLAILLDRGELEPGVRCLIERYLRPGDHFIDAGANVGMHVLAAARALRGHGRILAFEPCQATRALLERTLWINGVSDLAEVHPVALSRENGPRTLYLGATSGHHSLFPLARQAATGAAAEVMVMRLDDAIGSDISVTLIKIDVEGAEADVIDGARSVLANNPDVGLIVEFGRSHIERAGLTAEQWFAGFAALGFQPMMIDEHSGELTPLPGDGGAGAESMNLFFARPHSAAWARAGLEGAS